MVLKGDFVKARIFRTNLEAIWVASLELLLKRKKKGEVSKVAPICTSTVEEGRTLSLKLQLFCRPLETSHARHISLTFVVIESKTTRILFSLFSFSTPEAVIILPISEQNLEDKKKRKIEVSSL